MAHGSRSAFALAADGHIQGTRVQLPSGSTLSIEEHGATEPSAPLLVRVYICGRISICFDLTRTVVLDIPSWHAFSLPNLEPSVIAVYAIRVISTWEGY